MPRSRVPIRAVPLQEDAQEAQRMYRLDVTAVANASADTAHIKEALPELLACIMQAFPAGGDADITGVLGSLTSYLLCPPYLCGASAHLCCFELQSTHQFGDELDMSLVRSLCDIDATLPSSCTITPHPMRCRLETCPHYLPECVFPAFGSEPGGDGYREC